MHSSYEHFPFSLHFLCLCRVEGRTWYTSHRGRLWIAAAANRPTPQEIAEVEAMYRHIYKEGAFNVLKCMAVILKLLNLNDPIRHV